MVICAKNEAQNLKRNLPKILTQKNVIFELVIVNDGSEDDTSEVLAKFKTQYPNLKVVEAIHKGKKKALLQGLENASHDYFMLTDADCSPESNNWLANMSSSFHSADLVLGVSPHYYKNTLAGKLTYWETLLSAQNYLGMALAGRPYMGVGRNMGYSRELFEGSDKFESHMHIASGDDDLFVSQMGNATNSAVQLHRDSFTWSDGPKDLKAWWRQKRRHLSTSVAYTRSTTFLLGGLGLSQLIFYSALLPLLIYAVYNCGSLISILVFALLGIKLSVQTITVYNMVKRIGLSVNLTMYPLWEFLVVVFLAIIHFQNNLAGRPKTWN